MLNTICFITWLKTLWTGCIKQFYSARQFSMGVVCVSDNVENRFISKLSPSIHDLFTSVCGRIAYFSANTGRTLNTVKQREFYSSEWSVKLQGLCNRPECISCNFFQISTPHWNTKHLTEQKIVACKSRLIITSKICNCCPQLAFLSPSRFIGLFWDVDIWTLNYFLS